jgi:hypothetical protein
MRSSVRDAMLAAVPSLRAFAISLLRPGSCHPRGSVGGSGNQILIAA